MMATLLVLFASVLASLVSAGPPAEAQIATYNTSDCTGPVASTLTIPIPIGCNLWSTPFLVNGQPSSGQYAQINCPGNSFSYGVSACDTTVATSAVCIVIPTMSYKYSCGGGACKPESTINKQRCDYRATQCAAINIPMKWYVSSKA
jgi:hypothetical protein